MKTPETVTGESESTSPPSVDRVPSLLGEAVSATGAGRASEFYEWRSAIHRRVNGVLLTASVSIRRDAPDAIRVEWKLDYDGERQPLVILRPTLDKATCGQTEVLVYATSDTGRPHELSRKSPMQFDHYWLPRDSFVVLPEGRTAEGTIAVPLDTVTGYFLKHWPERFDATRAPPLRVQLVHRPTDRGSEYNLDAWTGELHTPVLPVELGNW